jgi:hypothetical protein
VEHVHGSAAAAELAEVDLAGAVRTALDAMASARLADVLRMRLGIGETPPMTLEQIGLQIGVSRERVRQLEVKALSALKRSIRASPGGEELLARLTSAIRPGEPGSEARLAAAVEMLCPRWPAPLSAKMVEGFVGGKGPRSRGKASPGTRTGTASLYTAVAAQFDGVQVGGRWKRFDEVGWFSVGQTAAECPGCGLVLEGFRRPYVTSAGTQYHYWALVCLACRHAWAPAELTDAGRHALYKDSEHRPDSAREVGEVGE